MYKCSLWSLNIVHLLQTRIAQFGRYRLKACCGRYRESKWVHFFGPVSIGLGLNRS
ncbi:hypothetical protein DO71_5251 [Burkholderia pseudomallei]|nr:hypothetical protein DO71_5251 [Burkholderia pseudomallei]KGD40240.1 hypothetical protein DO72_4487 [Burkholderia pseudomallei]